MGDRTVPGALVRAVGGLRGLGHRSLIEGVWQGHRGWLAVAAVVWGGRGLRRALRRQEKLLLREVLLPGEQVVVHEALVRPTRRQRRRAARAASGR